MTLEKKIKTGVASSLRLAALASGITYAEASSDYFNTENYSPSYYSMEIEVNTFTSSQTGGSNVNMFTDIDTIATDHNKPESIIKHALTQINNYHFIEVNDEIDRKIDTYFAKRKSNKTKKILLKRS